MSISPIRRRVLAASVASLAALTITVAGVVPAATAAPGVAVQSSTAATNTVKADIWSGTNAERAKFGLQPLLPSSTLDRIAQAWANKIATDDALSHNPHALAQAGGFAAGWTSLGENVAYNGVNDGATVVARWMGSPGHRANILYADFDRIGLGYARSWDGKGFYVQLFAGSESGAALATSPSLYVGARPVPPLLGAAPVVAQGPVVVQTPAPIPSTPAQSPTPRPSTPVQTPAPVPSTPVQTPTPVPSTPVQTPTPIPAPGSQVQALTPQAADSDVIARMQREAWERLQAYLASIN